MKRPAKKDKYILKPHLIDEYVEDLEKYCTELEIEKKKLKGYTNELEQKICDLQETIKNMEEERIERADLELEEMYGDDW